MRLRGLMWTTKAYSGSWSRNSTEISGFGQTLPRENRAWITLPNSPTACSLFKPDIFRYLNHRFKSQILNFCHYKIFVNKKVWDIHEKTGSHLSWLQLCFVDGTGNLLLILARQRRRTSFLLDAPVSALSSTSLEHYWLSHCLHWQAQVGP